MYCTILPEPVSTARGDDASLAYARLRREARVLSTISLSFATLTSDISAAYSTALTAPTPEVWSQFVARVASLVERTHALDGIVAFDVAEREALAFFEAIVRENADLLGVHGTDAPHDVIVIFPILSAV